MIGIKTIFRWFLAMMTVFILQKLYFLVFTWQDGTSYTDVLDVVWHGMKLDLAVSAYALLLPWLLLLLIPMCLPEKLKLAYDKRSAQFLKGYLIIIATLFAVIFVADASLYPFWQFKLDASIFLYTDKPKDALASVSTYYIIQRVIWFILWCYLQWRIYTLIGKFTQRCQTLLCKFCPKYVTFTPKGQSLLCKKITSAVVMLLSAGALVLMIRGGVGQGTNNVSSAYYSDNQYLNHAAVNPVFNLLYSMGKQEDFGSEYQFFDEKECVEAMEGIYHTKSVDPDTLLSSQRPDILLIVWEGCSEHVAECIGGAEGITPYLTDIAKDGILFSNCYANSYRTDRGLVCITAGWLGLPNASLMKLPQKAEKLPALPRTLLNAGYKTTFWYGGDISFTNMGGYMLQAGFSRTISDKDFTSSEKTAEWGAPDEVLLKRVADEMLSRSPEGSTDAGHPTFDAIMTLSSHEPWDVPTKVLPDERENSFNYADKCIGELVNTLKASPRWDNLLVIIVPDHGAMYSDKSRYDHGIIHIPMVWTGGAIRKPMIIDRLMNQSDLAATLLGQMGISHDAFTFSRDVMSKSYTYPTATFCYNNGVLFKDSTGTTIFDNDANRVIEGPDPKRERKAKATLQTLYSTIDRLTGNN